MTLQTNPVSGKPDNNTQVTDSSRDEFPGSLGERHARSFAPNPRMHRGTAQVVVGTDGAELSGGVVDVLADILYELRALRSAMEWAGTAEDLGDGVSDLV